MQPVSSKKHKNGFEKERGGGGWTIVVVFAKSTTQTTAALLKHAVCEQLLYLLDFRTAYF